jgi:hypothetical protein
MSVREKDINPLAIMIQKPWRYLVPLHLGAKAFLPT